MDNFFEFLIILFLIISFLSSIFKSKKKGQKQPAPPFDPSSPPSYPSEGNVSTETTVRDEDMVEFEKDLERVLREEMKETPLKAKEIKDSFETRYSEKNPFERPINYDISAIKKAAAKKERREPKLSEAILVQPEKRRYNKIHEKILRNVQNPESVRESIVMAEILGKPKALKRR